MEDKYGNYIYFILYGNNHEYSEMKWCKATEEQMQDMLKSGQLDNGTLIVKSDGVRTVNKETKWTLKEKIRDKK